MPLARTISRLACVGLLAALGGCAVSDIVSSESEYARMPREIRTGAADMVIERVEADVPRQEVAAAVQALVEREAICFPWPGLWLDASDRRNFYFARYDLMARDWGADVAVSSRQRMQEFVDLAFLTARPRPDLGADVVEYALTPEGLGYLRGSPYGGERPSFCAPSQRRVVEITRMDWGQYPCGNLYVGFTHVVDDWPIWARSESARSRVASTWGPPGAQGEGSVSLSRQWFRRDQVPDGMARNGALRSLCYDAQRQRVVGDDLELAPSPAESAGVN
jgi:hypothetical protein